MLSGNLKKRSLLCTDDLLSKKIGLSVKGNHDRAEKYIDLFKVESEKIFRPFLTAKSSPDIPN